MARTQRLDRPGAHYLLTLKSAAHRELFEGGPDYRNFLTQLATWGDQGGAVLGYCLLPEVAYVLVRAGHDGVVADTKPLMQRYAQAYNEAHHRQGALFNPHFGCLMLGPDQHLAAALRHIHRLPVSLGLVPDPAIFPWSSHRAYLGEESLPWLERQTALRLIGNQRAHNQRRYQEFMTLDHRRGDDWDFQQGNHPRYRALAEASYIDSLIKQPKQAGAKAEGAGVALEQIIAAICHHYGLSPRDLHGQRRHRLASEARGAIALLAAELETADLLTVAEHFGQDPDLVANAVRDLQARQPVSLHQLKQQLQQAPAPTASKDKPRKADSELPAQWISALNTVDSNDDAEPVWQPRH